MQFPKPEKKTKKKTAKKKKLSITKVQDEVNRAIRERDGDCIVRDGQHECAGVLTASHLFAKGGKPCLRFYPLNIFCQCLGHHGIHERKQNPVFYVRWVQERYPQQMAWMERVKDKGSIKYTPEVLETVYKMAKERDLEQLEVYIREKIDENN